jgi:hypothetical protein
MKQLAMKRITCVVLFLAILLAMVPLANGQSEQIFAQSSPQNPSGFNSPPENATQILAASNIVGNDYTGKNYLQNLGAGKEWVARISYFKWPEPFYLSPGLNIYVPAAYNDSIFVAQAARDYFSMPSLLTHNKGGNNGGGMIIRWSSFANPDDARLSKLHGSAFKTTASYKPGVVNEPAKSAFPYPDWPASSYETHEGESIIVWGDNGAPQPLSRGDMIIMLARSLDLDGYSNGLRYRKAVAFDNSSNWNGSVFTPWTGKIFDDINFKESDIKADIRDKDINSAKIKIIQELPEPAGGFSEDFVKSVKKYVEDPDGFTNAYPNRAAYIDDLLKKSAPESSDETVNYGRKFDSIYWKGY